MKRVFWATVVLVSLNTASNGQEGYAPAPGVGYAPAPGVGYAPDASVGYAPDASGYVGPASIGSSEPLFRYDDQERWKHGYLKIMPYYGGFHAFRPYNYHHVFSQSQTSAGWGMPAVMPYSQQFWHRYKDMADLSHGDHSPVVPDEPPPQQFNHYPKPIRGTWNTPTGPTLPTQPPIGPNNQQLPSNLGPAQPNYTAQGAYQTMGQQTFQPVQYRTPTPQHPYATPPTQTAPAYGTYAPQSGPAMRPNTSQNAQLLQYMQQR